MNGPWLFLWLAVCDHLREIQLTIKKCELSMNSHNSIYIVYINVIFFSKLLFLNYGEVQCGTKKFYNLHNFEGSSLLCVQSNRGIIIPSLLFVSSLSLRWPIRLELEEKTTCVSHRRFVWEQKPKLLTLHQ